MIPSADYSGNGGTEETNLDETFRPIPANGICERLGDKWTVQVLWRLSRAGERRLRFSALQRETEGITQRMLTLTLRNLERDGLVTRHYYPEVPPRVEYELTGLGIGILDALQGVSHWVQSNMRVIERNRHAYDKAQKR
ncbi:winged helix-turn-helix transcriptional regulator [Consotaella salsifontis]|uniref:Transcriptional regulator, HxlR family n=1 Tax=Consotaella salsifontis TaxID=1365950 RepID=A0A1T4S6I3_9HYPH|nr:helix-turn-helix domain-containing protein [Consotaella salsifontis]SKA23782.1 transcriptional regulator, HxlR family [Consotaella salsifontis]